MDKLSTFLLCLPFTYFPVITTLLCFCRLFPLQLPIKKTILIIFSGSLVSALTVSLLNACFILPRAALLTHPPVLLSLGAVIAYSLCVLLPTLFLFKGSLLRKLLPVLLFLALNAAGYSLAELICSLAGLPELNISVYMADFFTGVIAVSIDMILMAAVTQPLARLLKNNGQTIPWIDYIFFIGSQTLSVITIFLLSTLLFAEQNKIAYALTLPVLLLFALADVFLFRSVKQNADSAVLKLQNEALTESRRMQEEYYSALDSQYERMERLRHSIKSKLITLNTFVSDGDREGALSYISRLSGDILATRAVKYTGDPIIDAVLNSKTAIAAKKGIAFDLELRLPEELPFTGTELMSVFSNLLDNALEACELMPEGKARIGVKGFTKSGFLCLRFMNTCMAEPLFRDGLPVTVKVGGAHGLGTGIVKSIAHQHGGSAVFEYADGFFTATVMLGMSREAAVS